MSDTLEPLSAEILLTQGSCCGCGCENCPYIPKWESGAMQVDPEFIEKEVRCPKKSDN